MSIEDNPKNNIPKIITGMAVVLLLVIFSVQNSYPATIKIFFWDVHAPLVLSFVICFILGLFTAVITLWPISRHSKRKSKLIEELKARIETLEKSSNDNTTQTN